MSLWKKIDPITLSLIGNLQPADECFYAKDYVAGSGFQGGEVNSDILNFKKPPNAPGQNYRVQAINKFALEASRLINCDSGRSYFVTAIPSSKAKSDPLYDNRFEDFFTQLKKFCPCIDVVWPVDAINTVTPSHQSSGVRNPNTIKQNYRYVGFSGSQPDRIIVFDDLLTSGAHFRAYKDFILQSGFTGNVIGIFWAKSQ